MAGVTLYNVHPSRSLFMPVNQSQLTSKLKLFYSLNHFSDKDGVTSHCTGHFYWIRKLECSLVARVVDSKLLRTQG